MAPSDSRSVNRHGHGPLVCKFPINVTVPARDIAAMDLFVVLTIGFDLRSRKK